MRQKRRSLVYLVCLALLAFVFGVAVGQTPNLQLDISADEVKRIFANTQYNFTSGVSIVSNNTDVTKDDLSLRLKDSEATLPPIPSHVNHVTFIVNTQVRIGFAYALSPSPDNVLENIELNVSSGIDIEPFEFLFATRFQCNLNLEQPSQVNVIILLNFALPSNLPVEFQLRKLCPGAVLTTSASATSDVSTAAVSSQPEQSGNSELPASVLPVSPTEVVQSRSTTSVSTDSESVNSISAPLSSTAESELLSRSATFSGSVSASTSDWQSSTLSPPPQPTSVPVEPNRTVSEVLKSSSEQIQPTFVVDVVESSSSVVIVHVEDSETLSPSNDRTSSPSTSLLVSTSPPHSPTQSSSETFALPPSLSPLPSVAMPTSPGGGNHHLFGFDERSIWFFVIIGAIGGGGLLIILFLLIILLVLCCVCRRRRIAKKKKKNNKSALSGKSGSKWEGPHRAEFISPMTPPSLWTTLHWGTANSLPDWMHQTIMDYGLNRSMVAIHNTLKTGTYTCILRGRLLADRINPENPANIQLRIKMLAGFTEEGANRKEEVAQFVEQATLTKGLSHNNILRIVGLCAEDGYVPLVLYPYCEHGNMQSFLEKCRLSRMTDGRQMVTVQHQLTFCLQIAEGMLFMYQNGIVHPDLALRNCYMDSNFTVKISDGALTPDLYPDLYHTVYGVKRPVRWSALETLTQGICGSKSNVWSFGITCVETFTLGELPYASVRNRNILAHVLMGNRPARPLACPPEVYDLLAECWLEMTQYRPGFAELVQRLQIIVKEFTVREAAEIDGIIDDLCQFTEPFMSPPSEIKMLAQPYVTKSNSESTISESDLPHSEGQFEGDSESPTRSEQPSSPNNPTLLQPNNGPINTLRERHLTSMSTFSNDSCSNSQPPPSMLTREGSFRRSPAPSPLPSQRTPVPVRIPVLPTTVHFESGLTQSQSVSSGRSSTDVSSTSQRQLIPSKDQQEMSSVEKRKSGLRAAAAKRGSDPFGGVNISIGESMEDDFMAVFDNVLTKHTT